MFGWRVVTHVRVCVLLYDQPIISYAFNFMFKKRFVLSDLSPPSLGLVKEYSRYDTAET